MSWFYRWMESLVKVLKLSAQGLPQSWISLEQAVVYYAAEDVRWEAGQEIAVFHGGHNAITGEQSIIKVNSIIGTRGVPRINPFNLRPGLTNAKLFIRDRNVCAYCGGHFHENDLTREHIIPFAQNGIDNWMNVAGPLILFTKMVVLSFIIMWVRFSSPRFREDQLQRFAWKVLIPVSLGNIAITSIFKVVM